MSIDMKYFEEMEAKIPHGKVRTRFAPSPTGYMHVGNLRTALYTYLIARHAGGTFILRIEDTDQGRLVEGATDVIYRTMAECGLSHDEGPDVGGPVAPYIQSERRDTYGRYAELLVERPAATCRSKRPRRASPRASPTSFASVSRRTAPRPSTMQALATSRWKIKRLTIRCS